MHAKVFRPTLLLFVLMTSAREAYAETREARQAGRCNLSNHDWPRNPLELKVTATAAMSYKVQLSTGLFASGEWAIFAPLFVTNGTGKPLHLHYYIAFFDSDDRLVGCCNQGIETKPGVKDLQLGSCIVEGPKQRLLSAVKYQFTIYESDRWIGQEPISVKDAAALPGRSGAVTTTLMGAVRKQDAKDGVTVVHLSADCSFQETSAKAKDTHVEIGGESLLDVYLSTREGESGLTQDILGKKTTTTLRRWLIDANREVKRQRRGVTSAQYVALLDRQGQLVVCGKAVGFGARDLVAPKDRLLSASTLQMVVYESIADGTKNKQGPGSR
jgi:hypothetical protein